LSYHGGPVVKSAVNYNVTVNCNLTFTCWGNPGGFMKDLFASDHVHILDQYVGATANGRYTLNAQAVGYSNRAEPHIMEQSDLLPLLIGAVHFFFPNGGGGGYDKMYNIFLPQGQDHCFDTAHKDCYSPDIPNS